MSAIDNGIGSHIEVIAREDGLSNVMIFNDSRSKTATICLDTKGVKRLIKMLKEVLPAEPKEIPDYIETNYARKIAVTKYPGEGETYLVVKDTHMTREISTVLDDKEVKLLRKMLKG